MSGPKDGRGRDAFDDFFGDPTPSGRMGAASQRPTDGGGESTQDVGLDRDAAPASGRPAAAEPEVTQSATGAVPEDWWTSEPDRSPAASGSAWGASPAPQSAPGEQPPRRGQSPLALVAMLVGAVLVGGLCVGGTVMALNEDDEPVASHTTVTQTSSETSSPEESPSEEDDSASSSDDSDDESESSESSSESDSETESSTEESTTESSTEPSSSSSSEPSSESSTESSSSSSSSSTTMARSGEAPAGVTSCAGPSSGVSVGRGSDVTSCEFAVAVRNAYVAQNTEGAANLEVRSPVTDESYSMSCSGQGVTRCTGGNNAVVVLY